jgi:proteic killer suppression protein
MVKSFRHKGLQRLF